MSEPGRAVDSVAAVREGVEQFCEKHLLEIQEWVAKKVMERIDSRIAEYMAIRLGENLTQRNPHE